MAAVRNNSMHHCILILVERWANRHVESG